MRNILLVFLATLMFGTTMAQDSAAVVKWTYQATQQSDGNYLLQFRGDIGAGWKLFSTTMHDDQPNTRVVFDSSLQGKVGPFQEKGNLIIAAEPLFDNEKLGYYKKEVLIEVPITGIGPSSEIKGSIQYMALKGEEVVGPEEQAFRFSIDAAGAISSKSTTLRQQTDSSSALRRSSIDLANPAAGCGGTGGEDAGSKSFWSIFVLGFIGGLIGLFMPCTFPMIPLTVSFFTKKGQSRSKGIMNAFTYGFFIFLIYVLLSVPFYFLDAGSADILNNISTNAWLNLLFAVVFFIFSLSFFGLFEIALPSRFTNAADSKAGIGGTVGIFFMALTLAIVSFSCTGPILGTLLVGALNQNGGALQLTVAMAGFGLALGLPFALFALFPNWLSTLPRSGAWMNTVKIVFAFIELALMIKFLSNADLVMHWGLLKREIFFAIWILISLAASLYLFGILKFSYDPPPQKLSAGRKILALVFLCFAVYLSPGLTNTRYANRALISGFPPPLSYSIYGASSGAGKGVEAKVVNDYEKALALSKQTGKPLLIDFTGWACVNCRKMEENVWTQPEIREMIEKDFILVSLYVDDRKQLPENEQFIYTNGAGKKQEIRTVGDKFVTFQTENFKNASQPLYAIVSPEEKLMNKPVGYTPSAAAYLEWLKCGTGK
ncbi:protein-disulfide reductase DsbD family protein [Flavihumibacter profundi]|uniref:protein-disulfide reductase DsbD family protein n=1 Tax=Flavihumibacter profundi TaxID=2716883 RepID=UPI001CC72DB7|nr:thioredoxin family protein [Flavihumibacter profundi]MBZ5858283.1 thioredoxin family protein [Flavihumibacter profundi]